MDKRGQMGIVKYIPPIAAIALLILLTSLSGCVSESSSENKLPIPMIEITDRTPNMNEEIGFSGLLSHDDDGRIIEYFWDFGDGNSAFGEEVAHSYSSSGTFNIDLIITDNGNAKAIANQTVSVNAPPSAAIDVSKSTCKVYESIDFIGTFSSDPDGSIVKYEWNFGDGSISTGANPTHSFNYPGSYEIFLMVYDDKDAKAQTSITVDVLTRMYQISWKKYNESSQYQDFTSEESSTNKTKSLGQGNLMKITVTLQWEDDFPIAVIGNDSEESKDLIELTVSSPTTLTKTGNSTSGSITLEYSLLTIPATFQVEANDEVDAGIKAKERMPDNDLETGIWIMSVGALYCPGSIVKNGVMDFDFGNSWRMTFSYDYYDMVVNEI